MIVAMRKKEVTVYTLAKELGVTPGTISRALNNAPGISMQTRARVRIQAKKRGFAPRSFVHDVYHVCALVQRHDNEALMFSSFVDAVLEGIFSYADNNRDMEISLFRGTAAELSSMDIVRKFYRMKIDGAVVINADTGSKYLDQFDEQAFPYGAVMSHCRKKSPWLITIDNQEASRSACRHLIGLGHRRIGFLNHAPAHQPMRAREEGYLKALKDAKINPERSWICVPQSAGDEGIRFGYNASQRLLEECPGITALMVLDHTIAIGVYAGLKDMGRKVPQDVSVLCFDETPDASYMRPALSVVNIPNREMGAMAAEYVHQRLSGTEMDRYPSKSWMKGELILRESTCQVSC